VKYKNIKSAAHNLGHSFLSDTNAFTLNGNYAIVPKLLFEEAARRRMNRVTIDFLSGEVEPPELDQPWLRTAVGHYVRNLADQLRSQNVDAAAIRSVRLILTFDFDRSRRTLYEPIQETQEFACSVEVRDDRGKVHRAEPNHWWAV
jgi:hypothetical protein